MLRAVRFAARLGFEIDGPTREAIYACAPLAASLSAERVASELRGVLASPRPDMVWQLADSGLLAAYVSPGGGARARWPPCRPTPAWPTGAPSWRPTA